MAVVAVARKLACLFWCLLTREEDYAYGQPSLTKKKLRRPELAAGAPKGKVAPGVWSTNVAMRKAERELARQGEQAYKTHRRRLAGSRQAQGGRGRDTGTRISRPSKRQAARQGIGPKPCALARRRPRPNQLLQGGAQKSSCP